MSLHLVFNSAGYKACQLRRLNDDPIILLGDGVYCASSTREDNTYLLEIDARVRGIASLNKEANLIDYNAFIALTELYSPVVSWAE